MAPERTTWLPRLWSFSKVVVALAVVGAAGYWFWLVPTAVVAHVVQTGEVVAEVMGTGTLEGHVKATISTKIAGRLAKVFVDQGDKVRVRQEVARLDDQELQHQVEIEEANVTARRAGVERLGADKAYAKSVFDLAVSNQQRAQRLIASKAIAPEEYDKAMEALNSARAGLERTDAALVEGQKQLIAAEKTLEFHRVRVEDTVIVAPFAGLIVRRDRDPGDVVVPGSAILALVAPEEIWVRAWVDETRMAEVHAGQPARVVLRSYPDRAFAGQVVRLGRETDRETREFLVDVRPEKLPEHWTVGQRAEVFLEAGRKTNVPLLPARLVVWREGTPGAFVASEGRARWRELTLGLRGRETVEIVRGLTPGDVVIQPVDARTLLTDGQKVALP